MATVKASEIGIERLRHAQELQRESWESVATESYVAKATIYKLLKGSRTFISRGFSDMSAVIW